MGAREYRDEPVCLALQPTAFCRPDSQAWSANRRNPSGSNSERGFHFQAQGYVFYLLLPQAPLGLY